MKKKITSIVAALLIVTSVNVYATDTSKYKNKINQNNSKINELSNDKKDVQQKKNAVSSEVSQIINNINQLSGEIDHLSSNIAAKEAGITQKAQDIEAMVLKIEELEANIVTQIAEIRGQEEELTKQEDILSERVRAAYKFNSFGSMIFTLMQSTSIIDFTERLMFIEKMAEKDREVMAIIDGIIVDLEERRTELEVNKAESETVKTKLDTEKIALENEKSSLLSEKSSVEAKLAEQRNLEESKKNLLANMTQEERDIANAIGDIMEENEKLEEEVQRVIRAAQEKARREAEARAKALAAKNQKPAATAPATSGGFVRPVGGRITSPYGYRIHPISGRRELHRGVDYAAPMGTPVGSTKAGTVILRKYNSSYGNYVIVDHGNGVASLYAHLSGFAVNLGQSVGRGQTIGYIGSTGSSTGPHLHFEIRVNGVHKNPSSYVR